MTYCEICYEDHNQTEFVRNSNCGHSFCKLSYKDFLTYEIEKSGTKGYFIKCPQGGCGQSVSDEFVKQLCDEQTYKKFKQFQKDKEVAESNMKKFCPNPKCEDVVVEAQSKETTKIQCHNCK